MFDAVLGFRFTIYALEDATDEEIEEAFFRLNAATPLTSLYLIKYKGGTGKSASMEWINRLFCKTVHCPEALCIGRSNLNMPFSTLFRNALNDHTEGKDSHGYRACRLDKRYYKHAIFYTGIILNTGTGKTWVGARSCPAIFLPTSIFPAPSASTSSPSYTGRLTASSSILKYSFILSNIAISLEKQKGIIQCLTEYLSEAFPEKHKFLKKSNVQLLYLVPLPLYHLLPFPCFVPY